MNLAHVPQRVVRVLSLSGLTLIALAAVTATAVAPTVAAASCTDSWTNAAGGSWFTAGNWSSRVPNSGNDVCITLTDTYVVTMDGASVTVNSLTLGGVSGSQTLSIRSTCSAPMPAAAPAVSLCAAPAR